MDYVSIKSILPVSRNYSDINQLPLSGNDVGAQALVLDTNRLYIWNGAGWFAVALINLTPNIVVGADSAYFLDNTGANTVIELLAEDPEGIPITWSYAVTTGDLNNTATISQSADVFTITPSTLESDANTFAITFSASDGVNIATSLSTFTLAFTIVDSKYSTLMLKTTGVDGADNNTFIDGSTNNFAITRNGNTTQGAFSPYGDKWGNHFDGTGDFLTIPYNVNLANIFSSDTTIEAWVYTGVLPVTSSGGGTLLGHRSGTTSTDFWSFGPDHNGALTFYYFNGATILVKTNNGAVPLNTWVHIAVTFVSTTATSGTLRLWANGVLLTTHTVTTIPQYSTSLGITIGNNFSNAFYNGYVSNLRIVKGSALYTSSFTPPTEPLVAVTGTSLLTCQSNRFKDNSVNNFTITANGDVKVTKFSPYLPTEPYDPSTYSGSGYFDGNGDYLSTTTPDLSGADWTIELWWYPNTVSTLQVLMHFFGSGNTGITLICNAFGQFVVDDGYTPQPAFTGATFIANQWNHVAVARSGTTTTGYINGVQVGSHSFTPSTTSSLNIARFFNAGSGNYYAPGYFSDIRVVKGTAVYTANFTPPTEPLTPVANTSLLCNFTNANIYDETGKVVLETVGNAQVDTAVTKFGTGGSMYFDGVGDRLIVPSDPVFDFSGNFTIEMWINFTNVTSTWEAIISRAYAVAGGWRLYKNDSNNQLSWFSMTTQVVSTTGSTLANNTWSHVAVVRNSGTVTIYIDGINRGSAVNATSYTPGNYALEIGEGVVTSSFPFEGYIEDLRITKGVARYTANFTPPTQKLGFNNDE